MPRKKPPAVFRDRRFIEPGPSETELKVTELARQRGLRPPPILPDNRTPKGEYPEQIGVGDRRPPGITTTRDPLRNGDVVLGLPIHLTSRFTLVSGDSGSPPILPLKCDHPIYVREITFFLNKMETTEYDQFLGGIIGVALDLDGVKLTAGPTPIAALCTRDQSELRVVPEGDGQTPNQFTWRLPEPLYVPAGAILRPAFQHSGFLGEDVEVHISYSGNVALGAAPRLIKVPWVAAWASQPLVASSSDASDASQLINPFDVPVHVESLNGRLVALYTATSGANTLKLALESEYTNHQEGQATVAIRNSNGQEVTVDPMPFWQVFEPAARALETRFLLPPREYLLAEVATGNLLANTTQLVFMVAVAGWREVKRS